MFQVLVEVEVDPTMEWAGLTRKNQYHERSYLLGLLRLLYVLPAYRKWYLIKVASDLATDASQEGVNLD